MAEGSRFVGDEGNLTCPAEAKLPMKPCEVLDLMTWMRLL
jgi:hypothetical protein